MIEKIQRLPDSDRFLSAPSEDELKAAAECGPIVIIDVNNYHYDALIVGRLKFRLYHYLTFISATLRTVQQNLLLNQKSLSGYGKL